MNTTNANVIPFTSAYTSTPSHPSHLAPPPNTLLPALHLDLLLLSSLIKRNKAQHRSGLFLKRAQGVERLGRLVVSELMGLNTDGRKDGQQTRGYEEKKKRLVKLIRKLLPSLSLATTHSLHLISHLHFIPLTTVLLGIFSRMWVISLGLIGWLRVSVTGTTTKTKDTSNSAKIEEEEVGGGGIAGQDEQQQQQQQQQQQRQGKKWTKIEIPEEEILLAASPDPRTMETLFRARAELERRMKMMGRGGEVDEGRRRGKGSKGKRKEEGKDGGEDVERDVDLEMSMVMDMDGSIGPMELMGTIVEGQDLGMRIQRADTQGEEGKEAGQEDNVATGGTNIISRAETGKTLPERNASVTGKVAERGIPKGSSKSKQVHGTGSSTARPITQVTPSSSPLRYDTNRSMPLVDLDSSTNAINSHPLPLHPLPSERERGIGQGNISSLDSNPITKMEKKVDGKLRELKKKKKTAPVDELDEIFGLASSSKNGEIGKVRARRNESGGEMVEGDDEFVLRRESQDDELGGEMFTGYDSSVPLSRAISTSSNLLLGKMDRLKPPKVKKRSLPMESTTDSDDFTPSPSHDDDDDGKKIKRRKDAGKAKEGAQRGIVLDGKGKAGTKDEDDTELTKKKKAKRQKRTSAKDIDDIFGF